MFDPNNAAPVRRREIAGWAMFDFANSSYTTVIITAVYAPFFVRAIVPATWAIRDSWWSLAILLSTSIALLISPIVGAICDRGGHRKRWLAGSALVCAGATAALGFVGPGDVALAVTLVAVSNTAFMLSESFCGSFLPDLAEERSMARVSAFGWGVGYFGGLLSIIIALKIIITADADTETALWMTQNRIAAGATGAFFLLASLPTFLLVRERSRPDPALVGARFVAIAKAGFRDVRDVARTVRENGVLFSFFASFTVYMAGLDAVIKFVGIYAAQEVRLDAAAMAGLFLVLQLSAAVGAVLFGLLERSLGPRNTLLTALAGWIVAIGLIMALPQLAQVTGLPPATVFLGIGVIAGTGLGSVQSSSRAVVGLLAPERQTAQIFGFWSMFARLGSILGTSFGFAADAMGSRRMALAIVAAFFAIGAIMLARIDIDGALRKRTANLSAR
jgi:UMF1 family MFS transporter